MAADTGLRDRDLDPPALVRRRPSHASLDLGPFQRLIANPFLAILATVGWYAAVRSSIQAARADLFVPVALCFVVVPFLFQYHCLDCGTTGRLASAARHACPHVEARRQSGRPRRVRGPSPAAQTKLWLLALGVAGVYWYILG